jgi:hypothetical protein
MIARCGARAVTPWHTACALDDAMSPGGHLVTTAAACATTAYATGSLPLAAAVFAGGFLIDLDHAVDYVVFEKQRDLRPGAFLRYYVEGHIRRAVLVLHSYELLVVLGAIAWWTQSVLLSGYLVGALMHLGLDIVFNGRITPYSIAAFYSFGYRLAHRFDAHALLGIAEHPVSGSFWAMFFSNREPPRPLSEASQRDVAETPDLLP